MKKLFCIIIALLTVVLAVPMTVSAASAEVKPAYDVTESVIAGPSAKLYGIPACYGGARARDKIYGFNQLTPNLPTGKEIVTQKHGEGLELALQTYPFSDEATKGLGALGIMFYPPYKQESLYNIAGQNQKTEGKESMTDGKYIGFVDFPILNGSESRVSSFTICMPTDSSFLKGQLNGFDLWIGSTVFNTEALDTSNADYKLIYSCNNLVDTGAWKESSDGTFSFYEANLDTPAIGSWICLAFTDEGIATCPKGVYRDSDGVDTDCAFVLISEFAAFEGTLEQASAATTAEVTTEAPKTEPVTEVTQPKTEPAATEPAATEPESTDAPTEAPVITAAPGTEAPAEKKGCGSSVAIIPAAAVLALALTVCRKKKD